MDYWRLADDLSIVDAAILIVGESPSEHSFNEDGERTQLTWQHDGYEAAFKALKNAILRNRLQVQFVFPAREVTHGFFIDGGHHECSCSICESKLVYRHLVTGRAPANAVFFPSELSDPSFAFTLASRRMQVVGSAAAKHGNSTKRLLIHLTNQPTVEQLTEMLGLTADEDISASNGRLTVEHLERVTAEHIFRAIAQADQSPMRGVYRQSSKFDLLLDDGTRYPPKLIFGIAATEALGFEVKPEHFSAGWSQPCFNILSKSGYQIVAKGEFAPLMAVPLIEDDRTWSEGGSKLVSHLRKERASGLAQAKKAEFIRTRGKLFCESCGLDPVSEFGSEHGPSLIEVHHDADMVAHMGVGHVTRLSDLKCLCANCHRLAHSKLRAQFRNKHEKQNSLDLISVGGGEVGK